MLLMEYSVFFVAILAWHHVSGLEVKKHTVSSTHHPTTHSSTKNLPPLASTTTKKPEPGPGPGPGPGPNPNQTTASTTAAPVVHGNDSQPTTSEDDGGCGPQEVSFGEFCLYAVPKEALSYKEAVVKCKYMSGSIPSVHSADHEKKLTEAVEKAGSESGSENHWVGGYLSNGVVTWYDQSKYDYQLQITPSKPADAQSGILAIAHVKGNSYESVQPDEKQHVVCALPKKPLCPPKYKYYAHTGKCYTVFEFSSSNNTLVQKDADNSCKWQDGSGLVSIHSEKEQEFVGTLLKPGKEYWMGYEYYGKDSNDYNVSWSDGSKVDYYEPFHGFDPKTRLGGQEGDGGYLCFSYVKLLENNKLNKWQFSTCDKKDRAGYICKQDANNLRAGQQPGQQPSSQHGQQPTPAPAPEPTESTTKKAPTPGPGPAPHKTTHSSTLKPTTTDHTTTKRSHCCWKADITSGGRGSCGPCTGRCCNSYGCNCQGPCENIGCCSSSSWQTCNTECSEQGRDRCYRSMKNLVGGGTCRGGIKESMDSLYVMAKSFEKKTNTMDEGPCASDIFEEADSDKDGRITFQETVVYFTKKVHGNYTKSLALEIVAGFKKMDENNDGKIQPSEFDDSLE